MTTIRTAVLLALCLGFAACGSGSVTSSDDSTDVFNALGGTQIDFGAMEGQDTVLWFWAPW